MPTRSGRLWARAQVSWRQATTRRVVALWFVILLVAIFFQTQNPAFLTAGNLLDLVRAASTLGIVAMGVTLVIIAGELDLSVGSTYALVPTIIAVLWLEQGASVHWAVLGGLLAGALVGALNGVLTVIVRIPSFIVTLGMFTLVAGVSLVVSGLQYFAPASANPPVSSAELAFFSQIGASDLWGIPAQIIWLLLVSLVVFVLLRFSIFGFRLRAIGGNNVAARLARLPVARYRILVFVLAGLFAGLAGLVDFSFLGATQPAISGSGLTFPVFAAVIIGGTSLFGGSGTAIGTLTGVLLLQTMANGLSLVGAGVGAQQIFTGAITITAVALDRWADIRGLFSNKASHGTPEPTLDPTSVGDAAGNGPPSSQEHLARTERGSE